MQNNKALIVSRQGLGDGLIIMVLASHLKKEGFDIHFCHRLFHELKSYFPHHHFLDFPKDYNIKDFQDFDLIIVEDQNHPFIKFLKEKRSFFKKIFFIYPSLNKKGLKNLPKEDFFCLKDFSMVDNMLFFLKHLKEKKLLDLSLKDIKKTNDIVFKKDLFHKKHKKRVLIHPLSNSPLKNWRQNRFILLSKKLEKMGFEVVFILAFHELKNWEDKDIKIKTFKDFEKLADYIYESSFLIGNDSGPAHLASNLNIPSLVIASNKNKMKLWKPDFYPSKLLAAPKLIPNLNFLRLRNKYWSYFISVKKVFKNFNLHFLNHCK